MEQIFLDFAEAISPALQVLIEAVAIALLGTATAWVKAKYGEAKAQMNTDHQYILDLVVSNAVRAAEQLYTDNEQKREFALNVAQRSLEGYGIKLDLVVIVAAIEAQVFNRKSISDG